MTRRGHKLAWTLGLIALAGMAALLRAADTKPAPPRPSLAGTWTLNEDMTARMREDDQQSAPRGGLGGGMGRRGGRGGGGRRGGGGFPGGGGPGGSPSGGPEGDGGESRGQGERPSFAALDMLTITQTGDQVTIADRQGHTRVFRADGGKVRDDKAFGGPAEVQAKWDQDGSLVVEVRPDKGPKRTESYIVSNDGKHLYLVLTLEGERGSRKIRRAYDAAPAEKPEKAPPPADSGDETALA
jgi:hypothetical protein